MLTVYKCVPLKNINKLLLGTDTVLIYLTVEWDAAKIANLILVEIVSCNRNFLG